MKKILKNLIIPFILFVALVINQFVNTGPKQQSDNIKNDDLPPSLAMAAVVMGPMRGLITTSLWWRAMEQQNEGNYFEIMQISRWITALQPGYPEVWTFQSWNMAYNISAEFPENSEKWKWIQNAINMLQTEGLVNNRDSRIIKDEIARLFFDRIGSSVDKGAIYYQQQLALIMYKYLPNGLAADIKKLQEDPELTKKFEAETNLSVKRMLKIDSEFGPFDWRLYHAHVVYWGAPDTFGEYLANYREYLPLVRTSMEQAIMDGSLIYIPEANTYMTTNNFQIIIKLDELYDYLMENSDIKQIHVLHDRFCIRAISILYTFNQRSAARQMFEHLIEHGGVDKNTNFETFVFQSLFKEINKTSFGQRRSYIESLLFQSYFWMALGDSQRAAGNMLLATKLHTRTQQKFIKSPAKTLPPLSEMKKAALAKVKSTNSTNTFQHNLSTGINAQMLQEEDTEARSFADELLKTQEKTKETLKHKSTGGH